MCSLKFLFVFNLKLNQYNQYYQSGQSHAGDGANQLDCLTVVDVTVSHSELFSF